jgi:hypothetical protein
MRLAQTNQLSFLQTRRFNKMQRKNISSENSTTLSSKQNNNRIPTNNNMILEEQKELEEDQSGEETPPDQVNQPDENHEGIQKVTLQIFGP